MDVFHATLRDTLTGIWVDLIELLPQIAAALILIVVTALVARLMRGTLRRALARSRMRPSLRKLVVTLAQTMIWIGGLLIAATILFPGLTPAKLLTALGIGTLAVGLAFKDIFENYIAGVMIMLRKPMRIGDFVECGDVSGYVEDITVRDTYLRRTSDELMLLPNAYLFKNPVRVVTDRDLRRYELVCGVAYDVDLDAAREVIGAAVETVDLVARDRGIEVYAREFNDSSMDFTIRWWADSKSRGLHESRDAVVRAIRRALDEAGIEIPFPQRTLTFRDPLQLAPRQRADRPDG